MSDIVDRLATHRVLVGVPRSELEWLAQHGTLRSFEAGELVVAKGSPIDEMFIQFSGRVVSVMNRASGRRHLLETRAGDVTAVLPFSRMKAALGETRVSEETEALAVHRDVFPEMIRECPTVIERLVHQMLDRARHLSSTTVQDDQMQALGRLAAGLAHELNNPATAALRSSKLMRAAQREASAAATALGAAARTPEQRALATEIVAESLDAAGTQLSAIERADREAEIASWLEEHDVDVRFADALSESSISREALERLGATASGEALEVMLRVVAADLTLASLAREVEHAAARIHELVSAVKRFTNLDRSVAPGPMNVARGVADAATMLAVKARAKSVAVRVEIPRELPLVTASDELNQVWLNLLDNAIDAVDEAGEVQVRATADRDELIVQVIDNGPGISAHVEARMFDPFFTTKPQGRGSGLGLDFVRRALVANSGQIAVVTEPGRTEFRVSLPVASAVSTGSVRSAGVEASPV